MPFELISLNFGTTFSHYLTLSFDMLLVFSLVSSNAGLASKLLWLLCLLKWHLLLWNGQVTHVVGFFFYSGFFVNAILLKGLWELMPDVAYKGVCCFSVYFINSVSNCRGGRYQCRCRLHSGELAAAAQNDCWWKQVLTTAREKKKQTPNHNWAIGSLFNNSVTKQGVNRFRQYLDRTGYPPPTIWFHCDTKNFIFGIQKSLVNSREATLLESLG